MLSRLGSFLCSFRFPDRLTNEYFYYEEGFSKGCHVSEPGTRQSHPFILSDGKRAEIGSYIEPISVLSRFLMVVVD